MYWYISFLRAPPVSLSPHQPLILTPQIANDLRTEIRYAPTTLYYTFQLLSPSCAAPLPPKLLTTFSPPESTYKALSVELPSQARIGETWRIGVFANEACDGGSIADLSIMGVWSEGIEIVREKEGAGGIVKGIGKAKGKGKEKEKDKEVVKQSRIRREWRELKIIEQTSFDLDKKIWDSGIALSSLLFSRPVSLRPVYEILHRDCNVLEIGSGTGLVSIALSKILSASTHSHEIVATDLGSAIDLMEENIALNSVRVQARVLDWDSPLPDWVDTLAPHLIVAADVTYNTASFPSLIATLSALIATQHRPPLLLAYKERDPSERDLWDMLTQKGVRLRKIDDVVGSEEGAEGRVEIWWGSWKEEINDIH
ncbi:hypothetical protein P7C73_g2716, partial [Tremellales sp. Uapishka_1]